MAVATPKGPNMIAQGKRGCEAAERYLGKT